MEKLENRFFISIKSLVQYFFKIIHKD